MIMMVTTPRGMVCIYPEPDESKSHSPPCVLHIMPVPFFCFGHPHSIW